MIPLLDKPYLSPGRPIPSTACPLPTRAFLLARAEHGATNPREWMGYGLSDMALPAGVSWVPGGLRFTDADTAYLSPIPSNKAIAPSSPGGSVCLDVSIDETTAANHMLLALKVSGSTAFGLVFDRVAGKVSAFGRGMAMIFVVATDPDDLALGVRHTLHATVGADGLKLYVDGVLKASDATANVGSSIGTLTSDAMVINGWPPPPGWSGDALTGYATVYGVWTWSRCLGSPEVAAHAASPDLWWREPTEIEAMASGISALSVEVSDSIAISETVDTGMTVELADAITISEALEFGIGIETTDEIRVNESPDVGVESATALFIEVADVIHINPVVTTGWSVESADTITITEALAEPGNCDVQVSDCIRIRASSRIAINGVWIEEYPTAGVVQPPMTPVIAPTVIRPEVAKGTRWLE